MEQIRSIEQLDQIDAPKYIIFKHSTSCPISGGAYQQVAEYVNAQDALPVYIVLVIENRDVSNEIASRFDITHESPQVILVNNNKSVYTTSHREITKEELVRASNAS